MIINRFTLLFFISLFNLGSIYSQVVSISGQVLRHNEDPISNIKVICSSGDTIITDENGSFEFSDLMSGQDYQIDGIYEASIFAELSVLDACYNRFIINQISNSLNSQLIANDYNQDGLYQGLDFIRIASTAVKIENALNELDSPWRFFDGQIDNTNINTLEIEPGINLENLSTDTSGLVLIAIKSGDVAIDADHQPASSVPYPIFYFQDMAIEENEEIQVSLKVRDLDKIMGFQHGIVWDTNYLEFLAYENKTNIFDLFPNEEHLEEGLLPLMVIDFSSFGTQTISDDSPIYEIRFKALQDASSLIGILGFDSLFIEKQVVYIDSSPQLFLIEAECIVEENNPTSVTNNINHLISFDISPNPVIEKLNYFIQLPIAQQASLSLLDVNGKLIRQQSFNTNIINGQMNIGNLQSGMYYLKLQTAEGITSQSFIKF